MSGEKLDKFITSVAVALWVTVLFLAPVAIIVWLLKFILQTIWFA